MEDGADMVHEVANVDMAEIDLGVLDFMVDLDEAIVTLLLQTLSRILDPQGLIIMKEGVSVKLKTCLYNKKRKLFG